MLFDKPLPGLTIQECARCALQWGEKVEAAERELAEAKGLLKRVAAARIAAAVCESCPDGKPPWPSCAGCTKVSLGKDIDAYLNPREAAPHA